MLPICVVSGRPPGHGNPINNGVLTKEWFSHLILSTASSSSVKGVAWRSSAPSVQHCWLAWFCVCLVHIIPAAVSAGVWWPCRVWRTALHSTLPQLAALTPFLAPLLWHSLSLSWREGVDIHVRCKALILNTWAVLHLSIDCGPCKEEPLWPRSRLQPRCVAVSISIWRHFDSMAI